jgi:hypothetical protein
MSEQPKRSKAEEVHARHAAVQAASKGRRNVVAETRDEYFRAMNEAGKDPQRAEELFDHASREWIMHAAINPERSLRDMLGLP